MSDKVDDETWSDPSKTFIEPCCGNGQFVCYIIWNRLQHGIDWKTALDTLYALDLMEDNIIECHDRIIKMLTLLCEDFNEDIAKDIMNRNIVCHDFFTWDFENWRPED